jgi:hypothetical protein
MSMMPRNLVRGPTPAIWPEPGDPDTMLLPGLAAPGWLLLTVQA